MEHNDSRIVRCLTRWQKPSRPKEKSQARPWVALLPVVILAGIPIGEGRACATVHGQTLTEVKNRGFLRCGVSQGLPGFSSPDAQGRWHGFDVDFCRAIAAAIFGKADAVRFTPLSAKERFTALAQREVDLLARTTTWNLTRDTALQLDFAAVTFFDGQAFLVRRELGITSARQLSGATICVNSATTTELNVADYFLGEGLKYKIVSFEKSDEVVAAYDAGRCDAYTTDLSGIHADRVKLKDPHAHLVLPELISKEPQSPAVREDDPRWTDLVRWVHFARLLAEEYGLTSQTIDERLRLARGPSVIRLFGKEGKSTGDLLGLPSSWAYDIVKQLGNYGEVYERHLGAASHLQVPRGLNRLWSQGGLQYPMPVH